MGCVDRGICYNIRMSNTKTASKSILARLLASEDLSVVHDPSAQTASFDLKDRTLRLPVWQEMSNSLYDMLVGHEVAHALYTPGEDWQTEIQTLASMHQVPYRIAQMYVNVIEDARIERMIKSKFPGLRRDFLNAYVDLMNRDLFDLNGRSIRDLPLIDRLNLEFKVGLHAGEAIPFSSTECIWVKRIENATEWSDVLEIAHDLLSSIIAENEEQQDEESDEVGEESGEGSDSESDQQQHGDSSDEESDESGSTGGSDSEGDDDSDASGSGDESSETSGGDATSADVQQGTNVPESMTQDAFSKVSDSLRESGNGYCEPREMILDPIDMDWNVVDYKTCHRLLSSHWASTVDNGKRVSDTLCQDVVRKSKPTVNTLVKQFEMKKQADQHKRVQISKSGVLDTVKMMNYKWSEDVFRKNATVREGKNHGLVMFLDWSGSMSNQITETMEQLIQLVLFCKKVNIPFEVYAFTSTSPMKFGKEQRDIYADENHGFTLLNLFSSRMNKREFQESLLNNYALANANAWDTPCTPTCPHAFGLGGTPLNEAILGAISIVPKFKKENNVQIVNTVFLTDGMSNGMHMPPNGTLKIKGDRIGVKVTKNATNMLTELLRERTGSKIVNFFLADWGGAKFNRHAYSYFEDENDLEEGAKTWKKHNYAIATNDRQGWDEQYLVRVTNVNNDGVMTNVADDATAARKRTAFLKSMGAKMTSRVVLGRFIDQIA